MGNNLMKIKKEHMKGITLIALAVTILFSYDEKIKCSNSKGFLLHNNLVNYKIFTYLKDEIVKNNNTMSSFFEFIMKI